MVAQILVVCMALGGNMDMDINTDPGFSWTPDPDMVLVSSLGQNVTMVPVCSSGPSYQNGPSDCMALTYQYSLSWHSRSPISASPQMAG